VGRHLQGDRQTRTILDQPRDHREELDDQTDASGLEVVERGRDTVIGIILDARDGAFGQQAFGDKVGRIARLDARGQPAQVGDGRDVGRLLPIHRHALVEFKVRLGEQHDRFALRRDRRSRDQGVAAAFRQAVKNAVEVASGVAHRLHRQAELRTDRAHKLDVEAARLSVLDDVERRVWVG